MIDNKSVKESHRKMSYIARHQQNQYFPQLFYVFGVSNLQPSLQSTRNDIQNLKSLKNKCFSLFLNQNQVTYPDVRKIPLGLLKQGMFAALHKQEKINIR